jgi:hypothetical protein
MNRFDPSPGDARDIEHGEPGSIVDDVIRLDTVSHDFKVAPGRVAGGARYR